MTTGRLTRENLKLRFRVYRYLNILHLMSYSGTDPVTVMVAVDCCFELCQETALSAEVARLVVLPTHAPNTCMHARRRQSLHMVRRKQFSYS